ncbi:MAG: VOC family protein [Alphaproteobacteria bacterium]
MVTLERVDHFVMPVSDLHKIADFYVRVLGMTKVVIGDGRVALHFGQQKINLQPAGWTDGMRAPNHLPASQDFCLITTTPIDAVVAHLTAQGVKIVAGPGPRVGALGTMRSVYFEDPDYNLVEISNYAEGGG